MFKFKCKSCGEIHEGMPTFGFPFPIQYLDIPETERESRVSLGTDACVIDEEWFFVRGCIEIPVEGSEDPFIWGAWVSLSESSFQLFRQYLGEDQRSHIGPFPGWLCSDMKVYPQTCVNLKTSVHLRDHATRPYIELEPTDHPLAVEQRHGMTAERVAEIYAEMIHGG